MAKYGVWCTRSADSVFGFGEAWAKSLGVRYEFETREEAEALARQWTKNLMGHAKDNIHYTVKEIPDA